MDLLHKKIEYKFNIVKDNTKNVNVIKEIKNLFEEYSMIYSNILIKTYSTDKEYINVLLGEITSANIIERLSIYTEHIDRKSQEEFNKIEIDFPLSNLELKLCSICNVEMIQTYDNKFYECTECSIFESIDTIRVKNNLFPRSKIGNFNPERHFKTWIDRILARESESEIGSPDDHNGEKLIKQISSILKSKRMSIEYLTIDDIRMILKEIRRTNLNRNTSLIAKKLTGRSPPKLDENKYQEVYSLFLKIMHVRDELSSNTRCNRIYYPYYISKILSLILKTPEERKILSYVHLHKADTLSSNDIEWEKICKALPELNGKYTPTITQTNRYI